MLSIVYLISNVVSIRKYCVYSMLTLARRVQRAARGLHALNLNGLCGPLFTVKFYCFIPKGIFLV